MDEKENVEKGPKFIRATKVSQVIRDPKEKLEILDEKENVETSVLRALKLITDKKGLKVIRVTKVSRVI